jgi:hypothetical protein
MPCCLVQKNVPKKINFNVTILLIWGSIMFVSKQNDTLYLPTYQPTNQPNKTNPTTHNQTKPNPANQPTKAGQ